MDNDYINATIQTVRNKENKNTGYLGIITDDEFDVYDEADVSEPSAGDTDEEYVNIPDTNYDELDIDEVFGCADDVDSLFNADTESSVPTSENTAIADDIPVPDEILTEPENIESNKEPATNEKMAGNILDSFDQMLTNETGNEPPEDVQPKTQKYIYIAVPSEFLKGVINCFAILKSYLNPAFELYGRCQKYIDYFTNVVKGVKIGETHREPSVRAEELNGYTRNTGTDHLLFDIYDYVRVDEDKTDIEFHKYLEDAGYKRIQDDYRREFFDIEPDVALQLLKKYANKRVDFNTLTFDEICKLGLQEEFYTWLENRRDNS